MISVLFKFVKICFYDPEYGGGFVNVLHAIEKSVYSALVGWNVL